MSRPERARYIQTPQGVLKRFADCIVFSAAPKGAFLYLGIIITSDLIFLFYILSEAYTIS